MKYPFLVCASLNLSCTGVLHGEQPGPSGAEPAVSAPNDAAGSGGTGATTAERPPFGVRVGQPELLPFDVRVRRIASVLKVPVTSPMFADMLAKRVPLGDYDHAAGALPDNLWLARRISTWADSLTAVCAAPEMRTLFPALPENVAQLIKAAWGRSPTQEELDEIDTAVAEAALPAAEAYGATCMAVFTAGEFVFR